MSIKSTGSTVSAAQSSQSLWNSLLGTTPRLLLEDVYRFGEDYICDVSDTLETEILRICEDKLKRARPRVVRKDNGSGKGGPGPTDSALHAEVALGVDTVWETMVQAYELVGDQFEAYSMRNVFSWPEGLNSLPAVDATTSTKRFTQEFEEELEARVAVLEAQVIKERRKRRTLAHIKGLLSKRVPQAEIASKLLEEVMTSLQKGGDAVPGEAFRAFFDHALRLNELCDRLSAASPAASIAIKAVVDSLDSEAAVDSGGGGGDSDVLAVFAKDKGSAPPP